MRITYGTYVAQGELAGAELREEIRLVEQAGFEAIFFSEHHGVDRYPPSPIHLAAFALGITTQLRAGPMPLLLPLHNPVRIAEDVALLDHVSSGRMVIGLSPGYLPVDFEQIGVPLDERAARLDEGLEVLHQLWRGEPQAFDGRFYQVGGIAPLTFMPYQGRIPELWMATTSKAGMRRAARWGTGIVMDSVQPREDAGRIGAQFREVCDRAGVEAAPLSAICRVWLGDEAESDQFLDGLTGEFKRYVDLAGSTGAEWVKDLQRNGADRAAARRRAFVGSPADTADAMLEWADRHGVDHVILKFQWGERDFDRIREQLDRAAELCRLVRANSLGAA